MENKPNEGFENPMEMHNLHLSQDMDPQEKSYLSDALLFEGELKLLKGDYNGTDLFDIVSELDRSNPEVFFRQGLSLFEYGTKEGKEKTLLLANKKFKAATTLNPEYFDAWHLWGTSLSHLGTTFKEHHYFIEAENKLQKAIALLAKQTKDSFTLSQLHWDYAVVWFHMAKKSGEPSDFQHTLDAFQKAASYPEKLPAEFWKDFGNACLEVASKLNDTRLYVKATNCFRHTIATSSTSYEGWTGLAKTLEMLYEHTHDEDHFSQANECFSSAAQLNPHDAEIWQRWAHFLCDSGKRNRDTKRLSAAIEKCQRAYTCNPELPIALGIWAEALAVLGEISERIDLLYEAENKISDAIQLGSELPEVWYSYGICMHAMGTYFNDSDFYFQAIEKFQEGLSIDRTRHRLWHALALTYSQIGKNDEDTESLEMAHRFFSKAVNLHQSSFYLFDYAFALSKLGELTHEQKWLEQSVSYFERALNTQKNAIYIHPEWLFHYACTLDALGDFYEEEAVYTKAIEIFSHVLTIDPDFPGVHHHIALTFSHLGEFTGEIEPFYRSIHHYRLSSKHEEENDKVLLDFGLTLISLSQYTADPAEADQLYREAEHKLVQTAKLGNVQAYYHLGCLYSLLGQYDKALRFIEKSDEFESLPPMDELLQDDWLEGLRNTADFREFLYNLEKRPIPD